ncbi:MAG: dihydrolipoyllysine-residue acetyltransferase [Porticoccaceae bacterium]|nr:dihydrolipoyllysine-residue acetyltransferase [Porticoccaceae bacterium]MBT7376434.1 dihydrolipoyllysine-residue acetyltransferase [Porticoccaceae bacterium]
MKRDFILPDIGEGIVECEVIEWKVAEGDRIEEDQIVVDVSTDKAIVEIPSMHRGLVTKLYYKQGDIAAVHQPLFAIEVDEESTVAPLSYADHSQIQVETPETVADVNVTQGPTETIKGQPHSDDKVLTTPAVRKMARQNNLDLTLITGTGKQGRVLKEDVLQYLATASSSEQHQEPALSTALTDRVEPIKGVRKLMAERMADSVASIPHFTFVEEIDVTELVALRQSLKQAYAEKNLKITLMPLFIKALSLALKEFPIVNSRANDDFTQLTYISSHNIGLAVDGKTGLLVPNVKNVQQLGLVELAEETNRLIDAARSGKIDPADLRGGTISISNIGAIGGTVATPIINRPEVAIVALGRIQQLPRFDQQGQVVSRSIMTVSWSGDHRVLDGGTIARFNNLWKSYLEQPMTMIAAMI